MHRNHLAPCLIILGLGVALLLATGTGAASLGTLLFFLLCPIAMLGMMWSMGRHSGHGSGGKDVT